MKNRITFARNRLVNSLQGLIPLFRGKHFLVTISSLFLLPERINFGRNFEDQHAIIYVSDQNRIVNELQRQHRIILVLHKRIQCNLIYVLIIVVQLA